VPHLPVLQVGLAFAVVFAIAFALAVPRTSTHQSPHTLIVSFRTDSVVCAEREESAISFAFDLF